MGSWLVGRIERGVFKAGRSELALDAKDKKSGKAIGRFDLATMRADITHDASLPIGFGDAKMMLATKIDNGGYVDKPLATVLAFLYYQFGVYTKVDEEAFKRAGIKNIGLTPVTGPDVKDVIAESILEDLLEPIKATFRVENNMILIVPAKPGAKGK